MNLRDLEYAVCLAGEGQFRRAAARGHVSQPTVSAQNAHLEDELGIQLFERGPRSATPTVNGRAIIRQAQIVLDEVERLKALARAGQDPLQGPFHLGVIPTAGPYLMPRLLPVLRERWPQLRLLLREEQTATLLDRLRAGSLDAAILSPPLDGDDLRRERLLDEPILVALPRDHRLAAEKRIAPRALISEPIVLLEEGHCLRDQSLAICEAAGFNNRRDEVQAAGLVLHGQIPPLPGVRWLVHSRWRAWMEEAEAIAACLCRWRTRICLMTSSRDTAACGRKCWSRTTMSAQLSRGLVSCCAVRSSAMNNMAIITIAMWWCQPDQSRT
jgi:LysR family hydrogen peroxide-inducible transcriptional activator